MEQNTEKSSDKSKQAIVITPEPVSSPYPLVWLRKAIGPALSITGLGMTNNFFYFGVILTYIGGIICITEIWFDQWLRKRFKIYRVGGVLLILILLLIFTVKVVYLNAPLETYASIYLPEHAKGTIVGGITWREGFTDLRVSLVNSTDTDYSSVDLVIEPNEPIVSIGQISNIPGVSFIGDVTKEQIGMGDATVRDFTLGLKDKLTKKIIDPSAIQVSSPLYRVRCQLIPKKGGNVRLILAIAGLKCPQPGGCNGVFFRTPNGRMHMFLVVPKSDLEKVIFIRKIPSEVHIVGTYMVGSRSKSIDTIVKIQHTSY